MADITDLRSWAARISGRLFKKSLNPEPFFQTWAKSSVETLLFRSDRG
ncbi:hypothetical protein QUF70_14915 [Desulfobacterales bacterium HSG17]|nr:hypothetical protein [Desulfobacterales bacterium HSG17]